MEYDRIILEMLDRINKLEAEVKLLKDESTNNSSTSSDEIRISKKYRNLTEYFMNNASKSVSLSFRDIENLIGCPLPNSARIHRAFWANTTTHSIAHGWLAAGYKVVDVNMTSEQIVFESEKNIF